MTGPGRWQPLTGQKQRPPGGCLCSKSASNIWRGFSHRQDSWAWESRGGHGRGATHYHPSRATSKTFPSHPGDFSLCVTARNSLWRLLRGPSRLLFTVNRQAKLGVWCGVDGVDPEGGTGFLLHNWGKQGYV